MSAPVAPIAVEDLERVVAEFGTSRTLPASAYADEAVFAWEVEHLFGAWLCVGRVADLLEPGQIVAVPSMSGSLLISRDAEGATRTFRNVCRHRGHELLPEGEAIDTRQIRCPYHSWAYRLDGSLRTAPTFTQAPDFDPADWPLVEVRSEVWRGWLFIDASGTAPDLQTQIGNLDSVVAPYDPERLVRAASHDYLAEANWKLIVENYQECYHCSTIHPALCKVSPPDSGADLRPDGLWSGGTLELIDEAVTMSFDGSSDGVMLPGVDGALLREVLYLAVWPNILISAHPDYVMTHVLTPLGPNRTHIRCDWLFDPAAAESPDFSPAYAVDFWDVTNREDWAACEGVQRGIRTGGYSPGPLSKWETTLYQFQRMVGEAYLGRGVNPPVVPSLRVKA
jgi:phenylpropionate dioxygenase-like ring-hydroxylating dioxygenase large terminal subunit